MSREKKQMIRMNMRSAVLYAESQINSGKEGFFVNTEFGKVGVEINPFHDIDPFHPAVVLPWEESPETLWAIKSRNIDADYYLGINIFETEVSDHMAIIEGFTMVMMMNSGFTNIQDNIINAAVSSYINNYDERNITINAMSHDYIITHMNTMAKGMKSVQMIVRELFQQKIDAGKDVIEIGSDLLKSYKDSGKIPEGFFNDKYCEEIFGIMIYANMKQEKNVSTVLSNIINFNIEEKHSIAVNEN